MDTEKIPVNNTSDIIYSDVSLSSKKRKKLGLFVTIGLVCLIAIVVIVIIVARSNSGNKYYSKIAAAEKYLSELDYENAIASYRDAIAIDSTAVEAYLGLADIYLAMGKPGDAVDVLQEGIKATGSDELKDKLDTLTERNLDNDNVSVNVNNENQNEDTNLDENSEFVVTTDDFTNSYVGGYVTFGVYEQDGDVANGPEPIEWEVLDINENGILLMSKYVLDVQPYNTEDMDVNWENCTLRSWFNKEFINVAFDTIEQSRICTTNVENADNSYYGTDGGNDTSDKVFCLSIAEIQRYYSFDTYYDESQYGYCQKLITEPTQYAINRGTYNWTMSQEEYNEYYAGYGYSTDAIGNVGAWWWLRSPGSISSYACDVSGNGYVGAYHDNFVSDNLNGIRPALYVQP